MTASTPTSPSPPPSAPDAQWRRSNWKTFRYCLVVSLGAVLYGFDSASISGLIAIPRFLRDFGSVSPTTGAYVLTAGDQTLLYGMLIAGAIVACALSGFLGQRFGRVAGLYVTAGTSLVGPVVQIVAPNMAVMVVGKTITGLGIGFASNFCGTYWAEVAPPQYRGMITMMFQGVTNVASFVGACIIQGVYQLSSKYAWRTPIFVMMSAPLVMLLLLPLLPETPRWYVTHGRHAEARAALATLRGPTWPPEELDAEVREIAAMVAAERQLSASATYGDCFRGAVARRRTRIVVLTGLSQSFTGISFIAGYGTVFFLLSGIRNAFVITVITSVCALVGSLAAFPLVRCVGRRPILLTGGAVCGLCMLIFAIVGVAEPDSRAAQICLVAMVCIYLFAYGCSWGPVPLLVCTEIASNRLRSKLISLNSMLNYLANLFISAGSPYLISTDYANIGTKLGFIFGGCGVISFLYLWFDLPETKDRPLEDIDEMFLNNVPSRHFKTYVASHAVEGVEGAEAGEKGPTASVQAV